MVEFLSKGKKQKVVLVRAHLNLLVAPIKTPGVSSGCVDSAKSEVIGTKAARVLNNLLMPASVAELSVPEGMLKK